MFIKCITFITFTCITFITFIMFIKCIRFTYEYIISPSLKVFNVDFHKTIIFKHNVAQSVSLQKEMVWELRLFAFFSKRDERMLNLDWRSLAQHEDWEQ